MVTLLECNQVLATKYLRFCLPNTTEEPQKNQQFPLCRSLFGIKACAFNQRFRIVNLVREGELQSMEHQNFARSPKRSLRSEIEITSNGKLYLVRIFLGEVWYVRPCARNRSHGQGRVYGSTVAGRVRECWFSALCGTLYRLGCWWWIWEWLTSGDEKWLTIEDGIVANGTGDMWVGNSGLRVHKMP